MLVTSDFLRPNRNRSVAEPLGTSAPPSKPAARRSSSRRTAAAATPVAETPPAETPPAETPPDAQPTRKRRAMSVEEKKAVSERMKGSNDEWTHPHDPDAKITKMKDGRTHLAHKAEHAVDLETGAVVGVTVQDANAGDTTTMVETLVTAAEQVEAVLPAGGGIAEVVGDRATTATRRWSRWPTSGFAATCRSRIYLGGEARGRPSRRFLDRAAGAPPADSGATSASEGPAAVSAPHRLPGDVAGTSDVLPTPERTDTAAGVPGEHGRAAAARGQGGRSRRSVGRLGVRRPAASTTKLTEDRFIGPSRHQPRRLALAGSDFRIHSQAEPELPDQPLRGRATFIRRCVQPCTGGGVATECAAGPASSPPSLEGAGPYCCPGSANRPRSRQF